jgi:geranylgeranyl transferase type-2 subunit alpha
MEWADNILECSNNILISNPEYYTVWNERKRAILIKFKSSDCAPFIKQELMINLLAIKANPKSYSAWYHRRWFIEKYCEKIKGDVAKEELKLLSQLLDLDCRNCKEFSHFCRFYKYLF